MAVLAVVIPALALLLAQDHASLEASEAGLGSRTLLVATGDQEEIGQIHCGLLPFPKGLKFSKATKRIYLLGQRHREFSAGARPGGAKQSQLKIPLRVEF